MSCRFKGHTLELLYAVNIHKGTDLGTRLPFCGHVSCRSCADNYVAIVRNLVIHSDIMWPL